MRFYVCLVATTALIVACGGGAEKKDGAKAPASGNATENPTGNGTQGGATDGTKGAEGGTTGAPTTGCSYVISQTLGAELDVKRAFKMGEEQIDLELKGPVSATIAGASKDAKLKVSLKLDKLAVKPALAKSFITKLLGTGEISAKTLTEADWAKVVAGKKGGWATAGCDMLPLRELVLPGDAKLVFAGDAVPAIPSPNAVGTWTSMKHPFKATFSAPGAAAFDSDGEVSISRKGDSFAVDIQLKDEKGLYPIAPTITIVAGAGKYKSIAFGIDVPDAEPVKVELK